MEHKYFEHKPGECPQEGHCQYYDGGLGLCTVCGGAEGSLTRECCGFKLHHTVLEAVYQGGLDFKNGKWTVKENT